MKKQINILGIIVLINLVVNFAYAYEKIFYNDNEDTSFSTHFLEDKFGTDYDTYWSEFLAEVSRSTISHTGNYSMSYNPVVTGNPHANVGPGNVKYGNYSNFGTNSYNDRYWYFRWYQRWESSSYQSYVKIIYLSGGDYYYLAKTGSRYFILMLSSQHNGANLYSGYPSHSSNLDDEQWHKIEVYLDVGTAGDSNGRTWCKIDGQQMYDITGLAFVTQSNPVTYVAWPSTRSGDQSGSQRTWLDDQEIYILDGPNDIPGEERSFSGVGNSLEIVKD